MRQFEASSFLELAPGRDDVVNALLDVPANYRLIAQMSFGGIVAEPDSKEKEDIAKRVVVKR